ncbi:histidinol-phosphate transaminase [Paramaledivibacter caminithermalis]|jgi:histidinol-phosphate aminotransferase|uniref:Histidinol-phosphate aminotransferase n=1 Tax=Paramaledivibacter caminithermalis (strain DSM 15212 / CIP 107654 / DViRD3) TaxID=1121301 RepID=A0A1M6K1L6_PARC5|nr:histidinol-phosphate transaminase [Paramaledivibacter caminithermalis]SHJ52752.1 histidinol-phosphate aminotransferase [Paramaledivibacter caminithermalis DSM 15212]
MNDNNLFRKEVLTLKRYVPGKPIEEVKKELGLEDIVKLASNENPLGPSKKAVEAIKLEAEKINIYPDPGVGTLREKLAQKYDLSPEQIVVGNGGEEIIKLIAQTFINAGDEAIMASPSFGLYATSVSHMGGIPIQIPLKNYKHDFESFIEKINEKTKLIFVCNPNNPTGNIMTEEEMDYLFNNIPDNVVVVLDEAYYEYAIKNPRYPDSLKILKERPNTIILRTFSKVAGLAGVRTGYCLTSEEIVNEMTKVKGVFNANRLAQIAAIAALDDEEHIEKTVELNYQSMKVMEKYFEDNNLEYIKSNSNFVFVDVNMDSRVVFQKLLEQGVIIRPGYLWNWDNWLRVSTGTIKQTEKFIEKLDLILNSTDS